MAVGTWYRCFTSSSCRSGEGAGDATGWKTSSTPIGYNHVARRVGEDNGVISYIGVFVEGIALGISLGEFGDLGIVVAGIVVVEACQVGIGDLACIDSFGGKCTTERSC